jgi:hypothetical protein
MSYKAKSYRKFLATGTTAAIVASAIVPAASAASHPFTDVNSNYDEAVSYMFNNGITEGLTETLFGTDANLTRGDAAVIIARALELDTDNAPDAGFEDVNNRVSGAVNALVEAEIISGYSETEFKPYEELSRGAMAKILVNAYDFSDHAVDTEFTDLTATFGVYIEALYGAGITSGKTETTYGTNLDITRGEFAVLLHKSINFKEEPPAPEPPSELVIDSVSATANTDNTVTVTGKAYNADRVTVTIDGVEKTAELNANGTYTFGSDVLEIGAYEVTVTAYDGDESVSETTQVAVVDEATQIAGFVLDEAGNGVAGATVTVAGEEYTTNAVGFYQVKDLDTDRYYDLTITKPAHETQTERVRVNDDRVSSVITEKFKAIYQKDIQITGDVVNKTTGAAVSDATVDFQAYSEDLGEWVTIHTEDAKGSFAIAQNDKGITPDNFMEFGGEYRLVLDAPGYHGTTVDVTVNDHRQVTKLAATQLAPIQETTVTGKITRDGDPVENADVSLAGETVSTNDKGEYTFKDLKLVSGSYNISAVYTGGAGKDTVTTKSITIEEGKDLSGQNIELALGADVDFYLGAPVSKTINTTNLFASVVNSDGAVVAMAEATSTTEGDAKFDFDKNLPAGEYTVNVAGDYVVAKDYTFTVTDADVSKFVDADGDKPVKNVKGEQYEAVLGGSITDIAAAVNIFNPEDAEDETLDKTVVVVKDSNGKEVARQVIASEVDGDTEEVTATDFGGLVSGKYTIELYKPGYKFGEKSENTVTVSEGKAVKVKANGLDLVIPTKSASVQGLVRDADSLASVSDATVSFYQDGELIKVVDAGDYKDGVTLEPGIYTVVVRDNAENSDENGGEAEYKTYVEQLTLNNKDNVKNHHYNLEEEAAQIDLSIVDGANKALAADTITVYDAWADRTVAAEEEAGTYQVSGDAHVFDNLSVGEFDIVVNAAGYDSQTVGVSLEGNEDFRSTIVLNKSAATYPVKVNVVEKDTTAINKDAKVVVFDESGNIVRTDGTEFDLPNGTYTVASYVDGFYVSSKEITIDREGTTVLLEVEEGDWETNPPKASEEA